MIRPIATRRANVESMGNGAARDTTRRPTGEIKHQVLASPGGQWAGTHSTCSFPLVPDPYGLALRTRNLALPFHCYVAGYADH
jgi:hypothetical protein